MTVIINKSNSKNIEKIFTSRIKKVSKTGNLTSHFGKLKRNLDGLKYQFELRNN